MIPKSGNRLSEKDHAQKKILGEVRWAACGSLLIPGVDRKLLVKDAAKSMADLTATAIHRQRRQLGRVTLLTGCDVSDNFSAEEMLKAGHRSSMTAYRPGCSIPTRSRRLFPESAITNAVPVQCLL